MLQLSYASRAAGRGFPKNSSQGIVKLCQKVGAKPFSSLDDWRKKIREMRVVGSVPSVDVVANNSLTVFQNLESFSGKGLNAVDVCEAIAAIHGIGLKWDKIEAADKYTLATSSFPLMQSMNADELAAYVWGLGDLNAKWGMLPGNLQKGLSKAWKNVKGGGASSTTTATSSTTGSGSGGGNGNTIELVDIARDGLVRIGAPESMVRKTPIFNPQLVHIYRDYPLMGKKAPTETDHHHQQESHTKADSTSSSASNNNKHSSSSGSSTAGSKHGTDKPLTATTASAGAKDPGLVKAGKASSQAVKVVQVVKSSQQSSQAVKSYQLTAKPSIAATTGAAATGAASSAPGGAATTVTKKSTTTAASTSSSSSKTNDHAANGTAAGTLKKATASSGDSNVVKAAQQAKAPTPPPTKPKPTVATTPTSTVALATTASEATTAEKKKRSGKKLTLAELLTRMKKHRGWMERSTAILIQDAIKAEVPGMDKKKLLLTMRLLSESKLKIFALPECMWKNKLKLSKNSDNKALQKQQQQQQQPEQQLQPKQENSVVVAVSTPAKTPSAAPVPVRVTSDAVIFSRLIALADDMNGVEIVAALNFLGSLDMKWTTLHPELVLAATGEKLTDAMLFESTAFSAPLLEILKALNTLGIKWHDLPEPTRAAMLKRLTIDAYKFVVKNNEGSIPSNMIAASDSRSKSLRVPEAIIPPPPPPPPSSPKTKAVVKKTAAEVAATTTSATSLATASGAAATTTGTLPVVAKQAASTEITPPTEFFKGKFLSTCMYYLLSMGFNFTKDADPEVRIKAILSVEDYALRGLLTQLTAAKILYSLGKSDMNWYEFTPPEQETLKNVLKCCVAETNLWDLWEGLQGAARMRMPISALQWYSVENTIVLALKGELEQRLPELDTKAHTHLLATNVSFVLWSLATILRMPTRTVDAHIPISSSSSSSASAFSSTAALLSSGNSADDVSEVTPHRPTYIKEIRLEDELEIGEELQNALHVALLKTLPENDSGRFAITIWSLGKLRIGSKMMADFQLRVVLEDTIDKLVPLMDSLNLSNLLHGLGYLDVKFKSLPQSSRKVIIEALHRQSMFMNTKDTFGVLRGFAFMGVRESDLPPETNALLRKLIDTHTHGFKSSHKYINMIFGGGDSSLAGLNRQQPPL